MTDAITLLKESGIQATPQRVAVIRCVLQSDAHPSADEVWAEAKRDCPTVSRATVYNTLNLLVEKGLLRTQVLRGGRVVFDPLLEAHHHFVDEQTGRIYDIPWDAVEIRGGDSLEGFEVTEYQVVMKGRKRST